MMKSILALIIISLVSACSVGANSKCCKKDNSCNTHEKSAAPELTKEQMTKAMIEAGTPGENHKRLEPLVGEWKTVGKFWEEPGKDPMIQKGQASHKWILGKRFIKEDFNGKWMGQPFNGMGILGYDNVKKRYTSMWLDSVGTGVMSSEGNYNATNNTLEMSATFSCPVTGADAKGRTVTKYVNKNEYIFEMYGPSPDGKEVKMMEITYTRKR